MTHCLLVKVSYLVVKKAPAAALANGKTRHKATYLLKMLTSFPRQCFLEFYHHLLLTESVVNTFERDNCSVYLTCSYNWTSGCWKKRLLSMSMQVGYTSPSSLMAKYIHCTLSSCETTD